MTSTITWELYRSFLAVLNEGSLSAAARALGVTQPTIGRHVAALEQALDLVLFTRAPDGLVPTDAALSLRAFAQAMESTAAALERAAASQGDGVRGVVRVTASDVVGVEVLPPILTALREQHPALKIELLLSNRIQDLLHAEADIAVRMTAPLQQQLVARKAGRIELGLHASRDYLSRHGTPKSLKALEKHSLVGFDRPNAYLRNMAQKITLPDRDAFSCRSDSDLAQLALIRAGAGIGVCQAALAKRDGLVRVLPREFSYPLDTWVTMHEDLRDSPRCKATFDALVAGLKAYIGA